MKKILVVLALVAAAVASIPMWGGCDLNAKLCSGWCAVRHFNAEVKEAGCRARCSTEQLSCLAKKGQSGVDDFIEGFKQ
jgi:hypothetical protein